MGDFLHTYRNQKVVIFCIFFNRRSSIYVILERIKIENT